MMKRMAGDTLLYVVLAAVAVLVAYVFLSEALTASFRLDDAGTVEALTIELSDVGHHIALYHHPPELQRYSEPVILCHGLGANRFNMDFFDDGVSGDRMSLARTLARAGFDVWVLETRGHGRATVPAGADWTLDDEVQQDVATAIETVLDLTAAEKVLWVGHSWGGILQYFFFAMAHPLTSRVAGVVAIGSPGTISHQPYLKLLRGPGWLLANLFRTPLPVRRLAKLGVPISAWLNLFPKIVLSRIAPLDDPLLRRLFASLAEDIPPGILRLMLSWVRSGGLHSKDGTPLEDGLENLVVPTLLVAGSADTLAPPDAVKFVADRVGSEDVQYVVMGKERGCDVEYGHGGLLLGRQAPDEVFPVVERWLVRHATSEVTEIWSRTAPKNGKPNGHV